MSIETHPIGLPIAEITLATWWPGLDFDFEAAVVAIGVTDTLTPSLVDAVQATVAFTGVDTLTPGVGDVSALLALLGSSDTLTPSLVDAIAAAVAIDATDVLTPSLVGTILVDLPGGVLRALTVTLKAADGTPQVGATVLALRVRPGGGLRTVISVGAVTAVTDASGVAVLYLMPSFGDAYRIFATAADGRALLEVAVLLDGNAKLHELTPLEGLTWH